MYRCNLRSLIPTLDPVVILLLETQCDICTVPLAGTGPTDWHCLLRSTRDLRGGLCRENTIEWRYRIYEVSPITGDWWFLRYPYRSTAA